jgi:transketolase
MRKEFFDTLHNRMKENETIIFVTADLGFGLANSIKEDFPDRFYNVQAAEMAMLNIAVGLALEGRIAFCYSITPFLLWRAAETIRNYVNHESIPCKLIGSGRDNSYHEDGFSHFAGDDKDLLKCFPNINCYWPEEKEEIPNLVDEMISNPLPYYLNLKR